MSRRYVKVIEKINIGKILITDKIKYENIYIPIEIMNI